MSRSEHTRGTARGLGVHAETVRRWEKQGLLQAVRLPTALRRLRPEDIATVRERVLTGFPPIREDDVLVSIRAWPIED